MPTTLGVKDGMTPKESLIENVKRAIQTLLAIDSKGLARTASLGAEQDFSEVQSVAEGAQRVFGRIPTSSLHLFTEVQLNTILSSSQQLGTIFAEVLDFQNNSANSFNDRLSILEKAQAQYEQVLRSFHSFFVFGTESDSKIDGFLSDASNKLNSSLKSLDQVKNDFSSKSHEVSTLTEQLRTSLTEEGVSKQSTYFGGAAKQHADSADDWGKYTHYWAIGVAVIAVITLFAHKVPLISPEDALEGFQLLTSKILLVGTATFMLIRSSRIYQAHKHNEIINRHKQNSLLTFDALVEAGSTPEARNIVLNHAAASIYATPDTGYIKNVTDTGSTNNTVVEALPRVVSQLSE